MKLTLTDSQRVNLSMAILKSKNSPLLRAAPVITRRNYVCDLILTELSLRHPISFAYYSLREKTRVQMYLILAYSIGLREPESFDVETAEEEYGYGTVSFLLGLKDKYYSNITLL